MDSPDSRDPEQPRPINPFRMDAEAVIALGTQMIFNGGLKLLRLAQKDAEMEANLEVLRAGLTPNEILGFLSQVPRALYEIGDVTGSQRIKSPQRRADSKPFAVSLTAPNLFSPEMGREMQTTPTNLVSEHSCFFADDEETQRLTTHIIFTDQSLNTSFALTLEMPEVEGENLPPLEELLRYAREGHQYKLSAHRLDLATALQLAIQKAYTSPPGNPAIFFTNTPGPTEGKLIAIEAIPQKQIKITEAASPAEAKTLFAEENEEAIPATLYILKRPLA